MRTIKYVDASKGYAWVREQLQAVKVVKQIIRETSEGENTISLEIDCKGIRMTITDADIFRTAEGYATNTPISLSELRPESLGLDDDWAFYQQRDGRTQRLAFNYHEDLIGTPNGNGGWDWESEGFPPKGEFYTSKEICDGFSEYEVVDEDGTTHTYKGALARVRLTDEQAEAVEAVKTAMVKALELGVTFVYNGEYERMFMYNGKDYECGIWCRPDMEDHQEEADIWNLDQFRFDCYFGYAGYDDILCVEK